MDFTRRRVEKHFNARRFRFTAHADNGKAVECEHVDGIENVMETRANQFFLLLEKKKYTKHNSYIHM